jgi:hypothetical protein
MDSEGNVSTAKAPAMEERLRIEIESLRNLKAEDLKARYRLVFGEESASSNRAHLFRRIAWRLQAQAEGDLSEPARRRASELANTADLRLRAPLISGASSRRATIALVATRGSHPRARQSNGSIAGSQSV